MASDETISLAIILSVLGIIVIGGITKKTMNALAAAKAQNKTQKALPRSSSERLAYGAKKNVGNYEYKPNNNL